MDAVRPAAVAGMFYPADADQLATSVTALLAGARADFPAPKALIVPHAGYVYSGPVAASGYRLLQPVRDSIRRVVLLGPAHRVPFVGLAAPTARSFATPLGEVPVDNASIDTVMPLAQCRRLEAAHALEHSLEVHLPFLQTLLPEFSIVPLVVGDAEPEEVAEVIEALWGGPETLVVVSSDLSHYRDYETATAMDGATSHAIEALAPEQIGFEQACGRTPVSGLLLVARRHGMRATTIDLRNSGDTAGGRDRVVGYGAYAFH